MWLRPFLQSLTRLEDLSVELLGISRRLTLPPDCIPSSTQHVYWDEPSAHQLGTLLSYRSITSLAIGIDVDMPLMTHSGAIHPSSITDLSLIGAHRPPPILTHRPLRLAAVVRYYFRICSAEPDDIVSERSNIWYAYRFQVSCFRAACALRGKVFLYVDDTWETIKGSRMREVILRLRWNGPPENLLASEIVWLWIGGDGPVVVKFAVDQSLKRFRKAHRAYEGRDTVDQELECWTEVNKVDTAWAALGRIEARPARGPRSHGSRRYWKGV